MTMILVVVIGIEVWRRGHNQVDGIVCNEWDTTSIREINCCNRSGTRDDFFDTRNRLEELLLVPFERGSWYILFSYTSIPRIAILIRHSYNNGGKRCECQRMRRFRERVDPFSNVS